MAQASPLCRNLAWSVSGSVHSGHCGCVCDSSGQILHAWGDPDTVILPRPLAKMIQALPLGPVWRMLMPMALARNILALACASHSGSGFAWGIILDWLEYFRD